MECGVLVTLGTTVYSERVSQEERPHGANQAYLCSPVHSCLKFSAVLSDIRHRTTRYIVRRGLLWADVAEELHFEPANGRLANVDVHKDNRPCCCRQR